MLAQRAMLVLGLIHKIRKTGGRERIFPAVLLFLYEIISERHRILRGNPRPPAVRRRGKQRDRTLFFALFPLYFLVETQEVHGLRHRLWSGGDMHVKAVS